MKIIIDKVFILHLEKLKDRQKYLLENIKGKEGFINCEFIISNEKTDNEILLNNSYKQTDIWGGRLSKSEICNFHVHELAWKKCIENNYQNVLIIEDDTIFHESHNDIFKIMLDNVPEDYDCCFFSECSNLHSPTTSLFTKMDTSRCCSAYLIKNETCKKLLSIPFFSSPVDWHLNFVKKDLNLNYYWSYPIVFGQGSGSIYETNMIERGQQ